LLLQEYIPSAFDTFKLGSLDNTILEQTVAGTLQFPLAPDYMRNYSNLVATHYIRRLSCFQTQEPYLHWWFVGIPNSSKNSSLHPPED